MPDWYWCWEDENGKLHIEFSPSLWEEEEDVA